MLQYGAYVQRSVFQADVFSKYVDINAEYLAKIIYTYEVLWNS